MYFSENSHNIKVNNISVSYIDEGPIHDQTIILIHGFPLNKSMWDKQIEEFLHNYRVIAYDIRGHGNSDSGNVDFSIELFVKDLIGLMDRLKVDKAIVCGFSMGGYIALNAIENYPERFNALVLCDTNCTADSAEGKEKRMKTIDNIKEFGLEFYADESIKKLFAPISFLIQLNEITRVSDMIMKTSNQSLFKTLHALANREATCSQLHKIKVPVQIMVGKEDEITPPDVAVSMHEKIKDSAIQIIEHAGHLSVMEQPKEFNNQFIDFLMRNSLIGKVKSI